MDRNFLLYEISQRIERIIGSRRRYEYQTGIAEIFFDVENADGSVMMNQSVLVGIDDNFERHTHLIDESRHLGVYRNLYEMKCAAGILNEEKKTVTWRIVEFRGVSPFNGYGENDRQ